MSHPIRGLHHLTATVDQAQPDLDFYGALLGLRLVKQTVNFDNTGVYHFYYGTAVGAPGTIMTTFPYHGQGVRPGVKGRGQVTETAFSVPAGSEAYWLDRLRAAGVEPVPAPARWGDWVLTFADPSGLSLALVGQDEDDRPADPGGPIPLEAAIRGLHSVTLCLAEAGPTADILTELLGYRPWGTEGPRQRLEAGPGGPGTYLDLLVDPSQPRGRNGIGTVHHVALAITDDEAHRALWEEVQAREIRSTEILDRQYFHSFYFREPGGVLIEIATIPPGFAVDEAPEALGQQLQLPPWEAPRRSEIAAQLPPIRLPHFS